MAGLAPLRITGMSADEPTWRVYAPEWLTVYTSDQLEVTGHQECKDHFAAKYQGRVRPEDMRIRGAGVLRPQQQALQLRLPNLKGEHKDRQVAMDHYTGLPHAALVQRGSLEEQVLLDYGKKMLPQTG